MPTLTKALPRRSAADELGVATFTTSAPVLVVAPPGTGKTELIARRYRHLLHTGLTPDQILVCAFTNEAADNLKERIGLSQLDSRNCWIGTIHAIAARILRDRPDALGLRPAFDIIDPDRQARAMIAAIEASDHSGRYMIAGTHSLPAHLLGLSAAAKANAVALPDEYLWSAFDHDIDPEDAAAVDCYIAANRKANIADFDDLLLGARLALGRNPSGFRAAMVDEYQDLMPETISLVDALTRGLDNLLVAADDDQTIMGWAGASTTTIDNFIERHPGALRCTLTKSYRLPSAVLAPAMRLADHNERRIPRKVTSATKVKGEVAVTTFANDDEERRGVADAIATLIEDGVKPNRIAVIARTHHALLLTAPRINELGIEIRLDDGLNLGRNGTSGFVAICRMALGSEDPMAFADAARGLCRASEAAIGRFAKWAEYRRQRTPGVSYAHLLEEACRSWQAETTETAVAGVRRDQEREAIIGLRDLLGRVASTLESARPPFFASLAVLGQDLEPEDRAYAEQVATTLDALWTDGGKDCKSAIASLALGEHHAVNRSDRAVRLMTAHASKGRQFEAVFIVGFEEGAFPSLRSGLRGSWRAEENRDALAEERRLAFVAMTRSSRVLNISWAKSRGNRPCRGSRFLAEAGLGKS